MTACLVIDGYSGRPAAWLPPVVLAGDGFPEHSDGLQVHGAEGVVFRGLELTRFPSYGVRILFNAPDATIEACWMRSNGIGGVLANGRRLQLGSAAAGAAARNVVSGNRNYGIHFEGRHGSYGPRESRVENTLVGLDHDGSANANGYGIVVEFQSTLEAEPVANTGMDGIQIGSQSSAAGTHVVVSGNVKAGIVLRGNNALVVGALVGVGVDGITAVPNGEMGIQIWGTGNTVGVPSAGAAAVVVSGNGREGILTSGAGVAITNAIVGLGADATTAVPNGLDGIVIARGDATIGAGTGLPALSRVIASGNTRSGIRVGPETTDAAYASYGCSYAMPLALLDAYSTAPVVSVLSAHVGLGAPNANDGITVQMTNGQVAIGRPLRGEPAVVISGNGRNGVAAVGAAQMAVQHTVVGLSADGTQPVGNQQYGVVLGESAGGSSTVTEAVVGANGLAGVGDFRRSADEASADGWTDGGFGNDQDTSAFAVRNPISYVDGAAAGAAPEAAAMGADAHRDAVFMYELGQTYVISKLQHGFVFANVLGQTVYDVECEDAGSKRAIACPGQFTITPASDDLLVFQATAPTTAPVTAKLIVRDTGRSCGGLGPQSVTVATEWNLAVRPDDRANVTNGPNGMGCANGGSPVDSVKFDGAFVCDCSATPGAGDNCAQLASSAKGATAGVTWAGAGSAVFIALAALIAAKYSGRYRAYREIMAPVDFVAMVEMMVATGAIDAAACTDKQAAGKGSVGGSAAPREIPRKRLAMLGRLGNGAFGEVWKATLDEESSRGVPVHTVAAKTVLDPAKHPEATEELLAEAAVMAQVTGHQNLVSLVGVVTVGKPYVLVLSYCEYGCLQAVLRQRAADGNALSLVAKLEMAGEIAAGMQHLASKRFIHRDLAARNVLLAAGNTSATGMVCKVADFGLSRGGSGSSTADVADETYYKSQTGRFPVRWTAPEAMLAGGKFTTASDVWSFGVLMVEMLSDGEKPYGEIKANGAVMDFTVRGGRHPRPAGCSDAIYSMMIECWAADARQRPSFATLADAMQNLALDEVRRDSVACGSKGSWASTDGSSASTVWSRPTATSSLLGAIPFPVGPADGQRTSSTVSHDYEYAAEYVARGAGSGDGNVYADTLSPPTAHHIDGGGVATPGGRRRSVSVLDPGGAKVAGAIIPTERARVALGAQRPPPGTA